MLGYPPHRQLPRAPWPTRADHDVRHRVGTSATWCCSSRRSRASAEIFGPHASRRRPTPPPGHHPPIRENIQTAYIYLGIMAIDAYVYAQALSPQGGPSNSTPMSQERSPRSRRASSAWRRGRDQAMTLIFAALVFTINRATGGRTGSPSHERHTTTAKNITRAPPSAPGARRRHQQPLRARLGLSSSCRCCGRMTESLRDLRFAVALPPLGSKTRARGRRPASASSSSTRSSSSARR